MIADLVLAKIPVHAGRWRRPILVALMGLPGSGKTEAARYLATRFPLTHLATDAIRLRHGLPSGPATHEVIYDVAAALLQQGGGVIWDGIHPTRQHRAHVREFATRVGADFELIYTRADDAAIRARLAQRAAAPDRTAAEGKFVITPEKLAQLAAWLEPPDAGERVTIVDTTDATPGQVLGSLEARLQSLLSA